MSLNILSPLCNYAFIRIGILNSDSYKIKTSVTPKAAKTVCILRRHGPALALCKNNLTSMQIHLHPH